ncbi:MAG: competence/damage-inducible protein A, partial [Candidatus Puniceispirillum sp.]
RLPGGVQMTRITVQCQTGEGNIATILADVQARFDGVSVGSYPWFKPGQFGTAVVVSGLDKTVVKDAATAVEAEVRAFGAGAAIVNDDGTVATG